MKLNIEQSPAIEEVEITIRCGMVDQRLAELIRQIQLYSYSIQARREGRSYVLSLETICYFESVEDKTFAYTPKYVYECDAKLYELEKDLANSSFLRVSKSVVLNIGFVESVRPLLGARLEANLSNGEQVLINRHYQSAFKAKFGLTGGER